MRDEDINRIVSAAFEPCSLFCRRLALSRVNLMSSVWMRRYDVCGIAQDAGMPTQAFVGVFCATGSLRRHACTTAGAVQEVCKHPPTHTHHVLLTVVFALYGCLVWLDDLLQFVHMLHVMAGSLRTHSMLCILSCCFVACRQLQRQRRVIESSNLFADVQREYILNQLEVNVAAGAAQAAEELVSRAKRAARCAIYCAKRRVL